MMDITQIKSEYVISMNRNIPLPSLKELPGIGLKWSQIKLSPAEDEEGLMGEF